MESIYWTDTKREKERKQEANKKERKERASIERYKQEQINSSFIIGNIRDK